MKPINCLIACVFSLVWTASGQGTFNFNTYFSTAALVRYQTNTGPDIFSNPMLAPVPVNGGRVEVLWAPVGTTDPFLFQPLGPVVTIYPVPGRFIGGVRTVPWGYGSSGIEPGGLVTLMVRGWVGSASSWNEATGTATLLGYSAPFTIDTGDPTLLLAETPTSIVNAFPGLDLVYIPEPSSLALIGFGIASFLALRRRQLCE